MASTAKLDPAPVWSAIQAIPKGQTASYGQIALRAGYPGRARWVAQLLARQLGPKGLPWHRVVRSDGRIAFPMDSEAYAEQARRLRGEGVLMVGGRATTSPKSILDEAIWG